VHSATCGESTKAGTCRQKKKKKKKKKNVASGGTINQEINKCRLGLPGHLAKKKSTPINHEQIE
jgi:hypothetical protein